MAQNSVFAILLRSPWWISFLVAGLLALVMAAVLPEGYRALGAISVLPFVVVGVVAAWKQARLPSASRVAQTAEAVGAMAWPQFESLLQSAFERDGYTVQRSRSAGVDFELQRQGQLTLVSARRWKSARTGREVLQQLQAARESAGAGPAIVVALGELTDSARPYAAEHGITVWQLDELAQALKGLPLPARS